ncbi:DUF72 domain-containing protein [Apilactobacillus sp. TMW 2.2459]|uniref:DUF72 domain-containing protein n=1 Tax=Apilactobacillus xinyiensis TaxID=2841032 RepID=UPI00200CDB0F|nr:DUF72 domain-containing protein [Apilactobacillus xinyiensis]MCL0312852.1 DUF72 domain-containing protein [Apilactobacillus xinyiensis]
MITVGLTTWSEHPALNNGLSPVSLNDYAAYLPTVEIDNSFYGVTRISTVNNWLKQVPKNFQFIIKANQFMTKHDLKNAKPMDLIEREQVFKAFLSSIKPLVINHKLKTILFQFPPYFNCTDDNINYLRKVRFMMANMPTAIEFRNNSWYYKTNRLSTTHLLKELNFTEVIVDEPHNINTGVPFYPVVTNEALTVIRLHGRNNKGWNIRTKNWRKERTLYCYSDVELANLAKIVNKLKLKTKEVCIIFNNNSGKDAAPNALKLVELLNLHFKDLADRQLSLF